MSLRMTMLLTLLGLPYGYLLLQWSGCLFATCRLDGHLLFYTFVGVVALPFVMLILGGALTLGGARQVVQAGASERPTLRSAVEGTRGGLRFWIGLPLMIAAVPACASLLYLALDTPVPGRDRLGRICEKTGGATVCRPDPEADHPTELEKLNLLRQQQRRSE